MADSKLLKVDFLESCDAKSVKLPSVSDWGTWKMLKDYHLSRDVADNSLSIDMDNYQKFLVQIENLSILDFDILEGIKGRCIMYGQELCEKVEKLDLARRIPADIEKIEKAICTEGIGMSPLRPDGARKIMQEVEYMTRHPMYNLSNSNK